MYRLKDSAAVRLIVVDAGCVDLYYNFVPTYEQKFGQYAYTLVTQAKKHAACVVKIRISFGWGKVLDSPRTRLEKVHLDLGPFKTRFWDAFELAVRAKYNYPPYGSRILPRILRTLDVWKAEIGKEAPDKGHHSTVTA